MTSSVVGWASGARGHAGTLIILLIPIASYPKQSYPSACHPLKPRPLQRRHCPQAPRTAGGIQSAAPAHTYTCMLMRAMHMRIAAMPRIYSSTLKSRRYRTCRCLPTDGHAHTYFLTRCIHVLELSPSWGSSAWGLRCRQHQTESEGRKSHCAPASACS